MNPSTAQASSGDTVTVLCTGRLDDGTLFDSSSTVKPIRFVIGSGGHLPALEASLTGMIPGECKTVTIPAARAFGPRRLDLVQTVSRTLLPPGFTPDVGQRIKLTDAKGDQREALVRDVSVSTVTLDGNHTLAGKDLTFDLRLVDIQKGLANQTSATDLFHSHHYQRHNQRRLEHLASLGLDLAGRSVLEVGAGVGDHTSFFLDRACHVVSTEARAENLEILRRRFPQLDVQPLDLDHPTPLPDDGPFDIVYCYGLLYHLRRPVEAIEYMAQRCRKMLLLETCVSFGDGEALNSCVEDVLNPTQSISGHGCRPTRKWVFNQIGHHFPYVYMPQTQPNHEQFPLDWTTPPPPKTLTRSVFVASREAMAGELLVEEVPARQRRH